METPRGVFDVRATPYGPQMKKRLLSKHEVENKNARVDLRIFYVYDASADKWINGEYYDEPPYYSRCVSVSVRGYSVSASMENRIRNLLEIYGGIPL